jgi:DNA-binding FrmR family transcriptional regulator
MSINPDHTKNINRIHRIQGQLRGVEKMIEEKKYCMDVLQQTRAITSAIKSLEDNILEKHINNCVVTAINAASQTNKKIKEITDLFKKINS